MKRIFETAVIFVATLGWWGFVYPELCLTGDVYIQETAEEHKDAGGTGMDEQENAEDPEEKASCMEMSAAADRGTVRIKSRLMEYVYEIKEKQEDRQESRCSSAGEGYKNDK